MMNITTHTRRTPYGVQGFIKVNEHLGQYMTWQQSTKIDRLNNLDAFFDAQQLRQQYIDQSEGA